MTVGELQRIIDGLPESTPVILIDTSGRGLSPVYVMGDHDVLHLSRVQRYTQEIGPPQDRLVFAVATSGDSGDYMPGDENEDEIEWPGERW